MTASIRTSWAAEATVSFVIPTHRDTAAFRRALSAATRCEPPADEVVVAVDRPDDALVDLALAHGATVVRLAAGRGPAVARNAGAAVARGELLFFVDADVVVPPDVVGLARARFAEHPDLTAVIGTYDDEPAERNFFSQYKNLLNHYVHQHARVKGCTFWGACGVVRRDTFWSLGGFDPRYPRPTVEDIELGYRMIAAGHRIEVAKDLQVKHLKRWTFRGLLVSDVRDRALPWSALILRSGRLPDDLNVDRRSRVSALLSVALVASLSAAALHPAGLVLPAVLLAALVALEAPVLDFFAQRRGVWFAVRVMGWQLAYHLYSAGSFAVAVGHRATGHPLYRWRARRAARTPDPAPDHDATGPQLGRAGVQAGATERVPVEVTVHAPLDENDLAGELAVQQRA